MQECLLCENTADTTFRNNGCGKQIFLCDSCVGLIVDLFIENEGEPPEPKQPKLYRVK
ncbi:hypothetical protein [Effusibacillus consociatus]|uniref:ClpX-type ZB domain-containing protein n=1 Tax=Effusibacillus consociatus TaxID=1117041 RepID=A0ABV9Q4F9_9BACL